MVIRFLIIAQNCFLLDSDTGNALENYRLSKSGSVLARACGIARRCLEGSRRF